MKKARHRHLLQLCLLKTEVTSQGMSFLLNRDKTEKHGPKGGARARSLQIPWQQQPENMSKIGGSVRYYYSNRKT